MLRKFSLGGSSRRRSGNSASSSIGDPSLESPNLGTAASSGRKTLSGSGKFGGKKLLVDGSEIQIQQKLAEGGQAIIYLGRLVDGGAQYAKLADDEDPRIVVKKTAPVSKTQQDEAEAELALFKRLHSKHIARYVASDIKFTADKQGVEHPEVFLVLKYYEGGTLLDYAVKRRANGDPLMEEEILRLMYQVARAIEHLHLQTPPVSHRDIKLENVLLDADAQNAFLCDFGSATTKSSRCETKEERQAQEELIMRSTTPLYRAPELCDLYSGNLINEQVDVWAFGCALFALGTGGHAFEGGGALAILSGRLSFPRVHGLSPAFVRLVKWILTLDPAQRPQIGDVVDAILELCPSVANAAGEPEASVQRKHSASHGASVRKGARPPSESEDGPKASESSDSSLAASFAARAQISATSKSKSASDAARQRLASRKNRNEGAGPTTTAPNASAPSNSSLAPSSGAGGFDPFGSAPEFASFQQGTQSQQHHSQQEAYSTHYGQPPMSAPLASDTQSEQHHSQQEAYSTHYDQPFTFTPVSSNTTLQDQFQNPSPSSSYFASQQQSDSQEYSQFATQTSGQQVDSSFGQGYSTASQYGQETLHLSNETQYEPQATTQGHHDTPPQYAQQPDQQQFYTQQNGQQAHFGLQQQQQHQQQQPYQEQQEGAGQTYSLHAVGNGQQPESIYSASFGEYTSPSPPPPLPPQQHRQVSSVSQMRMNQPYQQEQQYTREPSGNTFDPFA